MYSIIDFREYVCRPDTPISEVLRRIDSSTHLFQVIVDPNGRLLGTVTDGDIRRAMLAGASLDDAAASAMHTNPVVGRIGQVVENRAKLENVGSTRTFLPLLDDSGKICEILFAGELEGIGSALVMAGGLGTRLGERTKHTPKPLLKVGGRPILDHVLSSLEDAGVKNMLISVNYLAEQIESYVAQRENRAAIGFIHEHDRLGTAGALGLMDKSFATDPFLVVNGDVITSVDYRALYEYHRRHNYDGTVTVARYDVEIPFGVIRRTDDDTFKCIDEKPTVSSFIAAGIYCLSPEFQSLVPTNKTAEMPDLLNMGKQIGLKIGLFPLHEYWTDVGSPHDLEAADRTAKNSSD